MECLLAEEITLAQHPYELLLLGVLLLDRHPHLALRYNEEGIAPGTLAYYVIASLVVGLLQDIGDLNERVIRQVFEDGNTVGR